jgi:hypothetical protein
MENEKIFPTKTGYCHVLPDRILLTRNGIAGAGAELLVGNSMTRVYIVYSLLIAWLSYHAIDSYLDDHSVILPIFSGCIILLLLLGLWRSRNNSATPIIERSKIKSVHYKKRIPGLRRSYFEVMFEDDRGRLKRRLIMLPGTMSGAAAAEDNALKIMQEEGFLNPDS